MALPMAGHAAGFQGPEPRVEWVALVASNRGDPREKIGVRSQ